MFIKEVLVALGAAKAADDLRPVTDVVEAWYRTMLVRRGPRFAALKRAARKPPTKCLTIEEVRAQLAV